MNRNLRLLTTWLTAIAIVTPAFEAARAEGFVDVRVGPAFTQDATAKIDVAGFSLSRSIDFEDSVSAGVRGGYWLRPVPWLGFALDVSYFAADENVASAPLQIDVVPISALLMLRAPLLKDRDFPQGRVQPYAGVGPGAFVTIAKEGTTNLSTASVDPGLDVRGGINFQILKWLAVFAEYRFTRYEASLDGGDLGLLNIDIDVDLETHHVAGGVGFHF